MNPLSLLLHNHLIGRQVGVGEVYDSHDFRVLEGRVRNESMCAEVNAFFLIVIILNSEFVVEEVEMENLGIVPGSVIFPVN